MGIAVRACLRGLAVGLVSILAGANAHAASHARPVIAGAVDDAARITLGGNVHPAARPENDRGAVSESLALEHMTLQLKRSAERETAFDRLIDALHDPASPHYHRWLEPAQIGQQFGPADADIAAVKRWLATQGFRVNFVHADQMAIDFSGTAAQLRTGFRTELHRFDIDGESHVAVTRDPSIPRALEPVVAGVIALNDFRPQPVSALGKPSVAGCHPGSCEAVGPKEIATIYHFQPLFNAGFVGRGQRIAAVNASDPANLSDWTTFRSTYGLAKYKAGTLTVTHPQPASGTNCRGPGINSAKVEAIGDAEWATATAPGAQIQIATCADTASQDGLLTAIHNLEEQPAAKRPQIISLSYGLCEVRLGPALNAAYNAAYKTAVAEGISIFVSSGDELAAGCDRSSSGGSAYGPNVNGLSSTAYNVAVGGTDFGDTYHNQVNLYWSGGSVASFPTAQSYIREIPWNSSCGSQLIAAGLGYSNGDVFCNSPDAASLDFDRLAGSGGGDSGCATGFATTPNVVSGTCAGYQAPSWQRGLPGLSAKGPRRTPDVAMFAANYGWGHALIMCVASEGGCKAGFGGTSLSTPMMAGLQALVNQKMKAARGEGNPNVVYYALARPEYQNYAAWTACNSSKGPNIGKSCIFHDITEGDLATFCFKSSHDCGGSFVLYGRLQPVYLAHAGWDYATGLGSVDATNLVNAWHTVAP
jgi:subtilase family serine protease